MTTQTMLPETSLAEMIFQVYHSGELTRNHRQYLKTVLLTGYLSEEEQTAINRLLHAVRRGWLQVLD